MPDIKWIGIVDGEISEYQKGNLDPKAEKMKMPATMQKMMTAALPFAVIPFLFIFFSMFFKTFFVKQVVVNPVFIAIGFILSFAGLFLHELLHAIVYPKEATVYIGFYPKAFAAVALASYPVKRGRFILMSLLPLLLGIVPLIIFWFSPAGFKTWNGFWFGFSIMGLISPYPDYYSMYQILKQTPEGCRIQFWGDDIYWIK